MVAFYFFKKRYQSLRPQVDEIHKDQLLVLLAQGTQIWDVRSEREWELSSIPGARQISHKQLQLPPTNLKVICVCNSGIRAQHAAETLKKMGHQRVAWLKGSHLDCIEILLKPKEES